MSPASPTSEAREQDLAAIRQLVADAEEFQFDPDRFTRLFIEDATIVNIAGIRLRGREALRQAMTRALATRLANVPTKNELLEITFIRPDVAVVGCIKHVFDENKDSSGDLPARGSLTFVVVKEDALWRIASAQTTPIKG